MRLGAIASPLLLCLLGGCSAVDVLNATAPRAGLRIERNIAYAPGPRHQLDVYAPADAAGAPVVVFFYGGGWSAGEKAEYQFVAANLASRGIVTIVPDYRLYPSVLYPSFLQDAAKAVAWAAAHAGSYGGDTRRLVLAGHSAGGYIAAMLALDRPLLGAVGLDPGRDIAGMVGLAGPYDFLPLEEEKYKILFSPAPELEQTQPITYVAGGEPPMLLISGTTDDVVRPRNAKALAAKLRAAGDRVEERYYPGVGHAELIGSVAWPLRFLAPTLDDVTRFVISAPPVATPPTARPAT